MTNHAEGDFDVRGLNVFTLSEHITVLTFDTRQDMKAARDAIARATNVARVSYLYGAEQINTREGREIWFWVNRQVRPTDPAPGDEG